MKPVKPIKGSQIPTPPPVPTPIPNNLQEECIRVQKVYDWVVAVNRERNKVPIPADCVDAVNAAIRAGQNITIECEEPVVPSPFPIIPKPQPTPSPSFSCRVVGIRREFIAIGGQQVEVGIVRFLFSATLTITILADGAPLCTFPATIQFDDEIVLCLPRPLDEDNILCRITAIQCTPTQNVLLGGMVELEVIMCKEIQVEAEVKLEVLAKFCQPRSPIPVPQPVTPPFECPPITFPPQCPSIFPVPNCDCQGTANILLPNLAVTIAGTTASGTAQLIADICPNCSPSGSTFSFTFVDPAGTQSFTFTPTTISPPTCVEAPIAGALSLTVTGTGVQTFTVTGTQDTLNYSLTLIELPAPSPFDTFLFTLTNSAGVVVFEAIATGIVPDAQLAVQDCVTFPEVIPGILNPQIP